MTPLERCLACDSPEAIDIRHLNGSQAYENNCNLSPSLTPLNCCRCRVVNVTWGGAETAAAPAVGMMRK
jgi:hypothetical protein